MDLLRSVMKMRGPFERRPDFNRFLRAVATQEPGPVPVGDLFADIDVVGAFLKEEVYDYTAAVDDAQGITPAVIAGYVKYLDQSIRFCIQTGWDYAYASSIINFPGITYRQTANTSPIVKSGKRFFMKADEGPIASWDDFARYAWPTDLHGANYGVRYMTRRVPDGMQLLVMPGGVFEWTTWLLGLVPFSYLLADQPDLVDAVIARVSEILYGVIADLLPEPNIGGIFMGDDLGFTTGTLASPAMLRAKFFPQTKRLIDLVHSAGKVFILHTCGNVYKVMDDLIAIGIDGKNSFEDKIMPVEEVYQHWGKQVALVGGVDMHILANGDEAQVRRRTREILDVCGPGGHYVLGTGNSVANYLPMGNYLAMLDEGRIWNKAHFGRAY